VASAALPGSPAAVAAAPASSADSAAALATAPTIPPIIGAPPPPHAPVEISLPPPRLPLPPDAPAASPPTVAKGTPPPLSPSAPPGATFLAPPPFADYIEFQETPPTPVLPGAPDAPPLEPVRRNYEGVAHQLAAVTNRDEIPGIILPYLGTLLTRVVLFTVRKHQLVGWDARGRRLRRETVEMLAFRLDRPSVFEAVFVGGVPFEGKLPQEDVEESLVIKLGHDGWPDHVVVVPIRVKGRPVAMIYGEAASADALAAVGEPARVLADLVGETFVRLIMQKKRAAPSEPP
jgi:hypothetical protein